MAISIGNLGTVAADRGDFERALRLRKESLALVRELGERQSLPDSLEELADVFGKQQQPERAARLLGAAEELREAIHMPVRSMDRTDYERTVAAVRAQLDEVAFSADWEAGRNLTLEQAIVYALASADD